MVSLPTKPTKAAPGTEDKLKVMEERAKLGQALFHPGDGKDRDVPVPTPHGWIGGKFFREMRKAA